MPSYIELDKQGSFPPSSDIGKVIFGVNTSNELILINNNGTVIPIGGSGSTLPYKSYVAKLTKTEADVNYYNGFLTVGKVYQITDFSNPDDFSNVAEIISGTINTYGCIFKATGTTPTTWTQGTKLKSLGWPIANVIENELDFTPLWKRFNETVYFNWLGSVDYDKITSFDANVRYNAPYEYYNSTFYDNLTSVRDGSAFNIDVYNIKTQSSEQLIVAGDFSLLNGYHRNYITRLNSDGVDDPTFYSNLTYINSEESGNGFDNSILSLSIQSDDKVLVVGAFTSVNGNTRNKITRLNSGGTEDTTFYTNITSTGDGSGFDGNTRSIAIQSDGKILVGGEFNSLNGNVRTGIASLNLNGVEDTEFYTNLTSVGDNSGFSGKKGPGLNVIITQSDGKILVGGTFESLNGNGRKHLVRLNSDGTEDTTFYSNLTNTGDNSGFNGGINTIAIQSDGKILVGGEFNSLNGTSEYGVYLVRLNSDGTVDTTYYTSFNGSVYDIQLQPNDNTIILSDSDILSLKDDIGTYSIFQVVRISPTCQLLNIYDQFNSSCYTAHLKPDNTMIIGGAFTSYNGQSNNYITSLNVSYDVVITKLGDGNGAFEIRKYN